MALLDGNYRKSSFSELRKSNLLNIRKQQSGVGRWIGCACVLSRFPAAAPETTPYVKVKLAQRSGESDEEGKEAEVHSATNGVSASGAAVTQSHPGSRGRAPDSEARRRQH